MQAPRIFRRSDPRADALATALDAIAAGATVEEALRAAPSDAAELRPLLETALQARLIAAPAPSDDARIHARAALLRAAADRRAPVAITPHPAVRRRGWLALAPAAAAVVLFAAIAVPLVGALDSGAIPGDWNYGIKRAGERVQLALTTDSTDRQVLRLTFARRRLDEIERLSQHGQVDVHSAQVVSLVHDYTADLSQVQSSVAVAPAVDPSTKQAIDKTTQAAQTVLQPIAQSAPPEVAEPAQSALDSTDQTKQYTDNKPSSTAATPTPAHATVAAASAPTVLPTEVPTVVATQPPTPVVISAATAPPTAAPAPSATAEPTAAPTPEPTTPATAAPATPVVPQLRPDQILPAVAFTPVPTLAPTVVPTLPPATATPQPIVVAAPAFGAAGGSPTPAPATTAAGAATPAPTSAAPGLTPVAAAATASPTPSSASAAFGPRTPSPTPAPVATRPATALTPAPTSAPIALGPGDNTLRYNGVPLPLDTLLAPILSDVVYVSYTDAAGLPHLWYPGTTAPPVGAGNSVFIVRVRQATAISLP